MLEMTARKGLPERACRVVLARRAMLEMTARKGLPGPEYKARKGALARQVMPETLARRGLLERECKGQRVQILQSPAYRECKVTLAQLVPIRASLGHRVLPDQLVSERRASKALLAQQGPESKARLGQLEWGRKERRVTLGLSADSAHKARRGPMAVLVRRGLLAPRVLVCKGLPEATDSKDHKGPMAALVCRELLVPRVLACKGLPEAAAFKDLLELRERPEPGHRDRRAI
jgi:hypothetical protein